MNFRIRLHLTLLAISAALALGACDSAGTQTQDTLDTSDTNDTGGDVATDTGGDLADDTSTDAQDQTLDATVDAEDMTNDTALDVDMDTGGDAQALCEDTGGMWDALACGHYTCGFQSDCEAIVPGCDCGPGQLFDDAMGCVGDFEGCQQLEEQVCTETGGTWDAGSCGHYVCGAQPTCQALIPGCDCGDGRTFMVPGGCADDPSCAP